MDQPSREAMAGKLQIYADDRCGAEPGGGVTWILHKDTWVGRKADI